jgi:NAD(P)-dependent dehydrogenase (short-subunit alcohol dehydrogenase family)
MDGARLTGRTALVTGGSSGIGAAIAARLNEEGARVAVFDISEPVDATPAQVFHRVDVTEPDQVEAAMSAVAETFGGLDILVNNAGILSGRAPFLKASKAELVNYLTVNAVGYVIVAQAAHR